MFVVGQTVSRIGNGAYTVALAWTVYSITGSPADMGLLLALNAVPEVALVMLGGAVGDRIPRRTLVMLADGVAGIVLAALTACSAFRILNIAVLAAAAVLLGIVSAFYGPAYSAMNRDMLRTEELRSANSVIAVCKNAAQVIGPALAGVVYASAGPEAVFGLDAASFAIAVAAMTFTKVPRSSKASPGTSIYVDVKAGIQYTLRSGWLRMVLVLSAIANVACLAPFFVLLADLVKVEHKDVHMLGWLISAQVIAAIIGALVVGSSRRRMHRPVSVLLVLAAVLGAGTLMLGFSAGFTPTLFGGALLVGLGFSFDVIENTLIQARVPADLLSRVYSVNIIVSFALLPAGYALAGVLGGWLGPERVLSGGGILLIGFCALTGAGKAMKEVGARSLRPKPAPAEHS